MYYFIAPTLAVIITQKHCQNSLKLLRKKWINLTSPKPTKVYAVWIYTIISGCIDKRLVTLFYDIKQAEDYANELAEKYRQKSSTTAHNTYTTTYTTSVTAEDIK